MAGWHCFFLIGRPRRVSLPRARATLSASRISPGNATVNGAVAMRSLMVFRPDSAIIDGIM